MDRTVLPIPQPTYPPITTFDARNATPPARPVAARDRVTSPGPISADAKAKGADSSGKMGLTNWLKPTGHGYWEMNPETGIARRTEKLVSTELETCAACHSRRNVIAKTPVPGDPYPDNYLPALLQSGLYYADGQIDGEV
jgi:hypothetical protein